MVFDVLVLAFVIALLFGGRFRNLAHVQLKHLWLAFVPVVLVVVVETIRGCGLDHVAYKIAGPVHVLQMFPFLLLLWFNRKISGTFLLALGVILNLFPIAFNGGKMPVSRPVAMRVNMGPEMKEYLHGKPMIRHRFINDETKFKWLSDIILVQKPPFYITPGVVSLGDVALNLGMCLFIPALMGASFRKRVNEQTS